MRWRGCALNGSGVFEQQLAEFEKPIGQPAAENEELRRRLGRTRRTPAR
jgi:hypothetical protein